MKSVVILGAGRLGQTLGYLLQHSTKYRVVGVWNRNHTRGKKAARFIGKKVLIFKDPIPAARAGEIVFITTSDSIIKEFCIQLVRRNGFQKNTLVVHCCGNFSSEILESARRFCACQIASLHPLQSFARPAEAINNFQGTYCAYEGTPQALPRIRELINELGGIPVLVKPVYKPIYHTAGVIASNYLVTLLKGAEELIRASGFPKEKALPALMPLVEGTLKNIKNLGIPAALTGPIARGDVSTVKNHLFALRKYLKHYLPFYKTLGRYTVSVARKKGGVSTPQIHALRNLLK